MRKIAILYALVFLAFSSWNIVQATVPDTLTYQGKLSDSSGSPVNGTVDISFGIYSTSSGGTASWNEAQSSVNVADGVFTVILGSVTPIPNSVFSDPDLYLGIKVGVDAEMTPRQKLHSAPFAIKAGSADTVADSSVSSTEITDGSIQEADLDTTSVDARYVNLAGDTMTGALQLPADGLTVGTNQLVASGGNVGIGTTSPTSSLEINGNLLLSDRGQKISFLDDAVHLERPIGSDGLLLQANDLYLVSAVTPIQFQSNDAVKVIFDVQNDKYGFGDLSPDAHLEISQSSGGMASLMISSNDDNDGDILLVDGNGNVGIGTTSPAEKLHLYKPAGTGQTNILKVETDGSAADNQGKAKLQLDGGISTLDNSYGNIEFMNHGVLKGQLFTKSLSDLDSGHISLGVADTNGNWPSTNVLTLDGGNNGNVGIGVDAAKNKLDVEGAVAIGAGFSGSTTAPTNGLIVEGKVGIGTTTPNEVLHVVDTSVSGLFENTNSSQDVSSLRLYHNKTAATGDNVGINFALNDSGGVMEDFGIIRIIAEDVSAGAEDGAIAFETINSGSRGERVRISSSGTVGIGTTSPASNALLHINKSTGSADIFITSGNAGSAEILLGDQDSYNRGGIKYANIDDTLRLRTTGSDRLTIDSSGNVGIGTTSPENTLHIEGAFQFQALANNPVNQKKLVFMNNNLAQHKFSWRNDDGTQRIDAMFFYPDGNVFFNANVGIGTTTPGQKLSVAGTIESTSGGIKFPDGTTQTTAGPSEYVEVAPIPLSPSTWPGWYDVDLSSYIPAGAKSAEILIKVYGSSGRNGGVRKNGSTIERKFSITGWSSMTMTVALDSNRIIERYTDADDVAITVLGYWK